MPAAEQGAYSQELHPAGIASLSPASSEPVSKEQDPVSIPAVSREGSLVWKLWEGVGREYFRIPYLDHPDSVDYVSTSWLILHMTRLAIKQGKKKKEKTVQKRFLEVRRVEESAFLTFF